MVTTNTKNTCIRRTRTRRSLQMLASTLLLSSESMPAVTGIITKSDTTVIQSPDGREFIADNDPGFETVVSSDIDGLANPEFEKDVLLEEDPPETVTSNSRGTGPRRRRKAIKKGPKRRVVRKKTVVRTRPGQKRNPGTSIIQEQTVLGADGSEFHYGEGREEFVKRRPESNSLSFTASSSSNSNSNSSQSGSESLLQFTGLNQGHSSAMDNFYMLRYHIAEAMSDNICSLMVIGSLSISIVVSIVFVVSKMYKKVVKSLSVRHHSSINNLNDYNIDYNLPKGNLPLNTVVSTVTNKDANLNYKDYDDDELQLGQNVIDSSMLKLIPDNDDGGDISKNIAGFEQKLQVVVDDQ